VEEIIEHRRNILKKSILISLKLLIIFSSLAAYKCVEYFRDNQEVWLKIFIIIALTLWILKCFNEEKIKWVKSSLNLPILLFILIMSISLFESEFLIISLRDYVIFLSYFLIFFLVLNNIENEEEFYSFIKIFYIITFIISIYTIIQYYGLDPYFNGLTSTIGQKNLISNYLASIFPIVFIFFLLEPIKKNRIFLFLLLSILYTTLMICQSRGIWISMGITSLFAIFIITKYKLLKIFKKNKKWMNYLLLVFIIITIIYSTENPLNKSLVTAPQRALSTFDEKDPSINTRFVIWKNTLQMIKDKPLFGSGIGTFKMNYLDYQAKFLKNNPYYIKYWAFPRDAHNEYLQIGAELGVIGLGSFLLILFIFFHRVLKYFNQEKDDKKKIIIFGLLLGVICFLTHSLFTFPLHIPPLGSTFFIILGLTTIYIKGFDFKKNKEEKSITKLINMGIGVKNIFIIITVIIMIIAIDSFAIKPYLSEVYSYKGKYNLIKGDYQKALSCFEYGESLDPYNGNILINLGATYYNLGLYNKVEGILRRAENYIKDKNIYLNLGLFYIQSSQYKEAEEEFEHAIYLAPNFTKAYIDLAYLYVVQKDYDKAILEWNKVLEIEPNFSEKYNVLYFIGLAYNKKKMPDKALEYFVQALQLVPEGSPIVEEIEGEIYKIYKGKLEN
jgi:O-antigen ligase/Tfp pilus assembly protein PilF